VVLLVDVLPGRVLDLLGRPETVAVPRDRSGDDPGQDAGRLRLQLGRQPAVLLLGRHPPKAWVSGEPGLDNAAAVYLAGLNPIAVGADTWGVEAVPPKQGDKIFYGHVTFLKENGIYILETMNTGLLVAQGVNEFMFVLGQARIRGVQMIINPVALW
jgi:kynurenine formamidase